MVAENLEQIFTMLLYSHRMKANVEYSIKCSGTYLSMTFLHMLLNALADSLHSPHWTFSLSFFLLLCNCLQDRLLQSSHFLPYYTAHFSYAEACVWALYSALSVLQCMLVSMPHSLGCYDLKKSILIEVFIETQLICNVILFQVYNVVIQYFYRLHSIQSYYKILALFPVLHNTFYFCVIYPVFVLLNLLPLPRPSPLPFPHW